MTPSPLSSRRTIVRGAVMAVALATALVHASAVAPAAKAGSESDHLVTATSDGLFSYVLSAKDGSATATVSFGAIGDQALVGDWDCDGTATPGVYRGKDGRVFLSNGPQTGRTDESFYYGIPGDIALAGDFNGDGCDTIAVYRSGPSEFHVRNTLTAGRADVIVRFGNPGDTPFVGDFDGDGRDTFGVYRRDRVYLSNHLTRSIASRSYVFGNPGDEPFAGDWNGDGKDSVALYRPSTGWVYLQDGSSSVFVGTGRSVLGATVDADRLDTNAALPPVPATPPPAAPSPATPQPTPTPQPPAITNFEVDVDLYPGDDLRRIAQDAAPGTVFRLNGTHTGQEIAPKDGQVFVGAAGAKLVGNGKAAAFRSSAMDVTIQGIEITGYSPGQQNGAIQAMGDGWVIRDNTIHHNGGVGVKVYKADRATILDNTIHHMEQLGVSVAYSKNSVVERNEIAYNNWEVKYSWGWEAGGTKFWTTDNLIVRDNWSHHNHGPGLWTDHDNRGTVYEGNLVEDNFAAGIFHEISYSAVIRENVARRNGFGHNAWLWGGGITIAGSQDVQVYANEVVGNYNGITMVQQDRGSGAYGPYLVRNNHVHTNRIVDSGKSGAARDVSSQAIFTDNNRFTSNSYVGDVQWEWVNKRHSWSEWRSFGHDVEGSYRD
jgi:hypothetical protein